MQKFPEEVVGVLVASANGLLEDIPKYLQLAFDIIFWEYFSNEFILEMRINI